MAYKFNPLTSELDLVNDIQPIPNLELPIYQDPSSVITEFQTSHGWTTSGLVASSNLNDTTNNIKGSQCASITTTGGAAGGGNLQLLNTSAVDLTNKALRFLIKVDDPTHLAQLNFLVGTNTSFGNSMKWQTMGITGASPSSYAPSGWQYVTVNWAEIHSASGTFSLDSHRTPSAFSGFTQLRFQVIDTGTAVTVHFQSVEIIEATTNYFPRGVVSVTFDDSWDNQYTIAKPIMDKYNLRGTVFVIAGNIGTTGRLTLTQLKNMQLAGWEIAGHAYDQTMHDNRYTAYTAAQVDADLRKLKTWLIQNGFPGDTYAYPGGSYELTTDGVSIEGLVAKYFSCGRTVTSGYGSSINLMREHAPTVRPYRMMAHSAISDSSSGPDLPSNVILDGYELDSTRTQGAWDILTFHVFKATSGDLTGDIGEITASAFDSILANIVSRGLASNVMSDVLSISKRVITDTTTINKGIVKLSNDFGGTATSPTVVGLHLAADTAINHKLTSVTDPTSAQDAVTKNYVDVTPKTKMFITTGSNASAGTGTLTGGTVTVSTTAVTANSLIFLTDTTASLTNVGVLSVSSKTAGTSFTVTSANVLDTSTFNWFIIN